MHSARHGLYLRGPGAASVFCSPRVGLNIAFPPHAVKGGLLRKLPVFHLEDKKKIREITSSYIDAWTSSTGRSQPHGASEQQQKVCSRRSWLCRRRYSSSNQPGIDIAPTLVLTVRKNQRKRGDDHQHDQFRAWRIESICDSRDVTREGGGVLPPTPGEDSACHAGE
jgi:hypothetical protein